MNEQDAGLLANSLVDADLRGVHSHGVLRVPEYVNKLKSGGVSPQGHPQIVRDSGACLVVDDGNSIDQIGTHFAMERVIERPVLLPLVFEEVTTAVRLLTSQCRLLRTT